MRRPKTYLLFRISMVSIWAALMCSLSDGAFPSHATPAAVYLALLAIASGVVALILRCIEQPREVTVRPWLGGEPFVMRWRASRPEELAQEDDDRTFPTSRREDVLSLQVSIASAEELSRAQEMHPG